MTSIYYVLRNKETGELAPVLYTNGESGVTPMLYQSERRAREGRARRASRIANPMDWEVVPVRLSIVTERNKEGVA